MPLGEVVVWEYRKAGGWPQGALQKGPPPGPETDAPGQAARSPSLGPGGYKTSFHLKLHKYPARKKSVITKATTLGEGKVSFILNIHTKHF